jgi:NADPH-dependent 2,4-dienoyl-CoA reductase/sulfur reductase-like enzyme
VLETEGHEHTIGLAPDGALDELALDLRLGRAVVAIDRGVRQVTLEGGERIAYDRLVLATGSRVRTLPMFPPGAPGVFYLRSLGDALNLRRALAPGAQVAVVGGGVIGMEVAASARARGCTVTVIEVAARIMARAASPTVSDYVAARHRAEGVDLRVGERVAAAARTDAGGHALTLASGERLAADVVVVGVGVVPNLELAQAAGLATDAGGVIVDAHGATSDAAVYAAGEVAIHYNAALGRHDRQETWNHASMHGEHVGRALVAAPAPYAELGSYWSDQYDINLQAVGAPLGEQDVVRGDPASGRFLVFHIAGGRIVGVSAVNAARELRKARRLIGAAAPADLAALSDPQADLALLA